jgi:hypothetical protein
MCSAESEPQGFRNGKSNFTHRSRKGFHQLLKEKVEAPDKPALRVD